MRITFLVLFWASLLFPHSGPVKKSPVEKELIQSLKTTQNPVDRQSALQHLYDFYKEKKIASLAHSYLEKLIRIQKTNKDLPGLETAYQELAHIYENKKDYPAALNHYFDALNYSTSMKKNDSGYIYLDVANLFQVMNRRRLAAKYLKKALDYTIKHKTPCLKIRVLNAYGSLAYQTGDYDEALKYIDLGLKTEEKIKKYVCGTDSLYRKALILTHTGKKKNAGEVTALLKKAVEKGLKLKRYENLLPVMNAYIQRLIDKGELVEAGMYLDKIDDIYAPFHPQFFFFYYLRSILFEKMDHMDEALIYYGQTAGAMEQYFSRMKEQQHDAFKEQTEEIYSRMITFYLEMYNRTRMKIHLHKAVYFSEVKNSYIYERITLENKTYTRLADEKKKLEKEYLSYHDRYTRLLNSKEEQDILRLDRYERKLEALKDQNDELNELILESPISIIPYTYDEFNVPRIRGKLKPGQLIVKYTLLAETAYAFYLDRDGLGYDKLDITSPRLVRLVRRLTEPLDDFTKGNVDYLRINYDLPVAHELYNILLKDILRRHGDKEEIFIIPDRELFKLPFEALVTGFNRRRLDPGVVFSEYTSADYFIQDYAVSYFLSLFHIRQDPPPIARKRYAVAAFGDPFIRKIKKTGNAGNNPSNSPGIVPVNTVNGEFFKELPASKKEILDIAAIFGKRESRIFSGSRFNRRNFEIYAPRSQVVHIATHFINNIRYPRYSSLLFSPLERDAAVDYFHAHEIFRMRLNTPLVVLSACESSEKNLLGMQGLRGMTASFKEAGARSMMVSMWPVDERSCRLVPLFYRHYREGKKNAAALREAKRELMEKTAQLENGLKISFSHPFLWANYILYNFNY